MVRLTNKKQNRYFNRYRYSICIWYFNK